MLLHRCGANLQGIGSCRRAAPQLLMTSRSAIRRHPPRGTMGQTNVQLRNSSRYRCVTPHSARSGSASQFRTSTPPVTASAVNPAQCERRVLKNSGRIIRIGMSSLPFLDTGLTRSAQTRVPNASSYDGSRAHVRGRCCRDTPVIGSLDRPLFQFARSVADSRACECPGAHDFAVADAAP